MYDNELKGPVSDITVDPADASIKTLTILGQSVIVKGEEVSDEIIATLVKRVDFEDKLELEGVIDAYTAGADGSITVLGIEYGLNGFTQYTPDPPNILPGDFVEIEDEDDPPNYSIDGIADEIEQED